MSDRDVVDQFTRQVETFVASPHVNAEEPVRRFLALVLPRAGDRALDVACGLLVISATLDVPIASQGAWAPFAKPFDLLKLKSAVAAAAARPGQRF